MRDHFGSFAFYFLTISVTYLWVALILTRVKPGLRKYAPLINSGAIYLCAVACVLSDLDRGSIGFFLGQLIAQNGLLTIPREVAR